MLAKNVQNALMIFNPKSGNGETYSRKQSLLESARKLGWSGELEEITEDRTVKDIVDDYIKHKGVHHVIACGGDGTVRDVMQKLVNKDVTMGIVPLGTGNVYAKNLGIPLDIPNAVERSLTGEPIQVDVGKANSTYFNIVAGVGIDAKIMASTTSEMKNSFGFLAYVFNSFKEVFKTKDFFRVVVDGNMARTYWATTVFVANTGQTLGGLNVAPSAEPWSGNLGIALIEASGLLDWLNILINLIKHDISQSPHYLLLEGTKVNIYPSAGYLRYECDGDILPPAAELRITVYPRAITILT